MVWYLDNAHLNIHFCLRVEGSFSWRFSALTSMKPVGLISLTASWSESFSFFSLLLLGGHKRVDKKEFAKVWLIYFKSMITSVVMASKTFSSFVFRSKKIFQKRSFFWIVKRNEHTSRVFLYGGAYIQNAIFKVRILVMHSKLYAS